MNRQTNHLGVVKNQLKINAYYKTNKVLLSLHACLTVFGNS